MTFTHALSTNNYGAAKFIVSADPSLGTHTSISSAVSAASAGDTVFVRPGTYSNSITLKNGVNICAYECDAFTPNVTFTGALTFTTSGSVVISGIFLQGAGSNLQVTNAGQINITIKNCYILVTGGNYLLFSNSNALSSVIFENCKGDLAATGTSFHTHLTSIVGTIIYRNCNFTNSGSSVTGASLNNRGFTIYQNTTIRSPIPASSTALITLINSVVDTSSLNVASISAASAPLVLAINSTFSSGTAAAIGTVITTSKFQNCIIISSNATPIGSNLVAGNMVFLGSTSTISSSIQNTNQNLGSWKAPSQPSFIAYQSANAANVTGDATAYTIISDTEIKDIGSNYNNATGVFTAPVTGKYLLGGYVQLSSVGAAHTLGNVQLVLTGRTVNIPGIFNPFNLANLSGVVSWGGMMLVSMTAADTVSLRVTISNSTKTVQVNGSGSPQTYFFGQLIA